MYSIKQQVTLRLESSFYSVPSKAKKNALKKKRKNYCVTSEFHAKFHAKNLYRTKPDTLANCGVENKQKCLSERKMLRYKYKTFKKPASALQSQQYYIQALLTELSH